LKFFFINTNKQWGGGEKWHFDTARAMHRIGHKVAILTPHRTELFSRSILAGITTIPVNISNLSFLNPFKLLGIRQLLKKESPDAIILNFSSDVKTIGLAAKMAGIKNIVYRRGNARPIKNTISNRFLFKNVINHVLTNSEETKRSVLQNNAKLFPIERIKVIYNGIDMDQYDHLPVEKVYTRKGNEIIIGSAGRLSPEKGHKYLLEMAVLLKETRLPFTILIAGEGSLEEELKRKTMELNVDKHLVFIGFIRNIKSFMSSIDIFVLPSLWEGFGYVTIEAMAASKPVVAFRVGSNPEIITDQKTGFLVDPYNVATLTEKIRLLMNDPALRETFGAEGRKRTETVFNLSRSEKNTEDYLTSL
jgi:glycosyltransferase involved in cell wall biosynthesis